MALCSLFDPPPRSPAPASEALFRRSRCGFSRSRLARRELAGKGNLRPLRDSLQRPSRLAPHPDARRLGRPPPPQGFSGRRLSRHSVDSHALYEEPIVTIQSETSTVETATGTAKTMVLNMTPQHPSTHGVLRILLELDGENVVKAIPDMGYLHTGIEKSCEDKTYSQAITLTDRIDYLNPLGNNLAYCMAVEKLLGIEVPKRALYIRRGCHRAEHDRADAARRGRGVR